MIARFPMSIPKFWMKQLSVPMNNSRVYSKMDPEKMKVHQGKVLKYLGMTLDFNKRKKVILSMFDNNIRMGCNKRNEI